MNTNTHNQTNTHLHTTSSMLAVAAGLVLAHTALAQDASPSVPAATPDAQPASQPVTTPAAQPVQQEDTVSFAAFSEPVDINVLLQYVQRTLNININVDSGLQGTVALNAPIEFPRSKLLAVFNSFLEQRNYTMTYDPATEFYAVIPVGNVVPNAGSLLATTRVFRTPGVRPSSLMGAITQQIGPAANLRVTASNDLGAIIVTSSARQLALVEMLIDQLMAEHKNLKLMTFDLEHIAAHTARDQVLMLTGNIASTATATTGQPVNPRNANQNAQPVQAAGDLGNLSNFGSRLGVAPQGNALLLRGSEDEREQIQELLAIIDRPNTLEPKRYFTGSATRNIAQHAKDTGLGRIHEFSSESAAAQPISPRNFNNPGAPASTQDSATGGSFMISDSDGGYIMYFGTQSQHTRFDRLVETFKTEGEIPVVRVYKLHYSEATQIAEIIQALISGQQQQQGGLLTGLGNPPPGQQTQQPTGNNEPIVNAGGQVESFVGGEGTIAVADEEHNQIVVKAPMKLQAEFASLIDRLDRKRAQVYIQAQIVAVNSTDEFRLRLETQLINAQGKGGAFRTNFGLSNDPEMLTNPLAPLAALSGGSFALIQSQYTPIVINALQSDVDGRIISTPQLLVNDNEETEIASINTFPFASSSQNNNSTVVSFDGSAEAGTTFSAQPQITGDGSVDLAYSIELSSFTGPSPADGAPPPIQRNNINGGSVTVPTGMTVVVGGLQFKNAGDTIVKVPYLGDIPLLGHLFRDTQKRDDTTTLYIFLTPRILDDPNFNDLMLLTRGPQADMLLDPNHPALTPIAIDAADSMRLRTEALAPGANPSAVPGAFVPGAFAPPTSPASPAGQGESDDGYE